MHRLAPAHGNPSLRAAPFSADGSGPFIRRLLNERQRRLLGSLAMPVVLKPRQFVYREGAAAGSIFICSEGALKSFRELPSGKRRIATFIFSDDLFGLAEHGAYLNSVQAITEATCHRLPLDQLASLLRQDAELEWQFLCKITHELREAQRRAILLGRRSAKGRIAMFLSALDRQQPDRADRNLISLPMSRSDIADFLGLTLESVSRAAKQLARDGIVKFEEPRVVRLVDRRRIDKLAADL